MKKIHGFTLIELLVVIAILGILSAIVLASLNASRQKSRVASLKAEVTQIKNEAEIFYATHNSYIAPLGNSVCDDMTTLRNKVAELMNGQPYPFAMCLVTQNGNGYATEVALGDNAYWCADSSGYHGFSQPEPTGQPSGLLSNYDWSDNRICDGDPECGNHSRTICSPAN
jgi:prepilin-type N-terminal cleavage/methylation domain-containing protein